MGGIVGNGKKDDKEIYFESEYTAETKIRQWEIDLNCFDKNFYLIICKLNTKSFMNSSFISKIITKEILEKYFSDRKLVYEQILDEKIFLINDEKYKSDYDSEKIKCLVFLLTFSNPMSGNNKIQDKSKFLYYLVNEDDNEGSIHRNNSKLINFITNLVLITSAIVSIF